MSEESRKVLILDDSCICQTKYEGVSKFEESIFKEVYFEAYNSLVDIVNIQRKLLEKKDKSKRIKARNFDVNNIIAFVGDRGSGKTSCMMNFRRSLKDDDNRKNKRMEFYKTMIKNNYLEQNNWRNVLEERYEILTVIDPSLFSTKDSLVEIVVAQMFNRFKDRYNDNEDSDFGKKQELVKQFEKVYKDIMILNTNKDSIYNGNYDNLEALVALGSAISLKDDMSKLVECYIKYMSPEGNGFLVISIDDIDMNLRVGEKMIEDIRKYLIIPRVIILIAVKMEQLKQIIQQRYLVYLKDNELLEKELDNIYKDTELVLLENYKKDIINKTDKYLEKVIPYNRRIKLPNLQSIINKKGEEEVIIQINYKYFMKLFEFKYNSEIIEKVNDEDVKTVKIDEFISKISSELNSQIIKFSSKAPKKEIKIESDVFNNLRKFIECVIFVNTGIDSLEKLTDYTDKNCSFTKKVNRIGYI